MRRPWSTYIFSIVLAILFFASGASYARPAQGRKDSPGSSEITEVEDIIEALGESIKKSERTIKQLAGKIDAVEKQIEQAEKKIADSGARLDTSIRLFGSRVKSAYMNGGANYLEVLLNADNFGDLIVRSVYLKKIMKRDTELITSIKCERKLIAGRRKEIRQRRRKLSDLMEQARAEHGTMLAQRREKEKLLEKAVSKTAGYEPVYGVVLDNSKPARPQAGLAEASQVYEFEVEGSITRYLALFSAFPNKVGPIRSARTHSVMLARENKVHYIYASGTKDVLATIANWGLRNTNALFSGSSSIYRSSDRRAPHNLYVNLARLGKETPSNVITIRPAFLDQQGKPSDTVSLKYNSFTKIKYSYRSDERDYLRYLNGQVHRDASGKEIAARNIILQYVPHYIDPRGRPTPNLIGSGKIEFYSMGQRFNGTWQKESAAEPTRYYYADGQPLEMVYGRTWIQIVRSQ